MGPKRKVEELDTPERKPGVSSGKIYYNVEHEQMPNSVVLDPNFIKLSNKIDDICHQISEALKVPHSDNKSIKAFVDEGVNTIRNRKVDSTVMSLIGPMGSGKSETINTILHESIAPTGKSGSSMTLVPHKYCKSTPNQKKRFLAKIKFYSRKYRSEFFEDALAAYYRAKNASDSDPTSDYGGDQDGEDVDACDTVVDALHALFMGREECKTRKSTIDFLKTAESENDQRILKRLLKWADSIIEQHENSLRSDHATIEADTAETLLAQLAAYTSEVTEDDGVPVPSLWPLVSAVSIHFENPLSKLGVSLLDVPGSSDNHIRRKVAQQYARQASHAAIIAQASRANSGNSISKEVKAVKGKGDGRLMVLITCSDEIDSETIVGGTPMDRQEVKKLKKHITSLDKQLNATKLEQVSADISNDEAFRLYQQENRQKRELDAVCNQEEALRIRMRGQNTREAIQRKLSEVTNFVNPVPVFWLSNLPYRKHRAGYMPHNPPKLTVEETNGPAVRGAISEFPNVARMKQLEHVYNTQLPTLLSRIQLFNTRAPIDLKADIEGFVNSPLDRFPNLMEKIMARIKTAIHSNILDPMKEEESRWLPKAETLCDKWAQDFAAANTMLTLMNRDGRRRAQSKKPEVNLSNELQSISSSRLDASFGRMLPVIKEVLADLMADLDYLCDGIIDGIKNEASGQLMMLDAFYEVVDFERQRLRHEGFNWANQLVDDLEDVKIKATLDDEDAYMANAMRPVYAKVRLIKYTKGQKAPRGGWPKQRHVVFKAEVTKPGHLWTAICQAAEHDLDELHTKHKVALMDLVRSAFENICSAFDGIKTEESDDPAAKQQKTVLADCLRETQQSMQGEMKVAYNALREAFPTP